MYYIIMDGDNEMVANLIKNAASLRSSICFKEIEIEEVKKVLQPGNFLYLSNSVFKDALTEIVGFSTISVKEIAYLPSAAQVILFYPNLKKFMKLE